MPLMPHLPDDILDRLRNLERQVRQLTTYVNTRAAAAPARSAEDAAGERAGGSAQEGGRAR
ncbi:hypothetical protein AT728_06620 [Streptomyces silvensis]|uniref:Uncharacterized protein n=2 Tax=Streptomyces silvensis TaxID=1765722 RepID=A0A0W7X7I8_9ACTN|nr:hypothetical protein AT728_06620 [Streptomyces silvensis]